MGRKIVQNIFANVRQVSTASIAVLGISILSSELGYAAPNSTASMVACVASQGGVSIRAKCRKGEKVLTLKPSALVSAADVAGPQGPQGPQGSQGPQGIQGPKGDVGPSGPTGATGAKGEKGEKGDKGETGPKGDTGAKGDAGAKGDTGATGATGERGASAFDDIPQGRTVYGVVGGDMYATAGIELGVTASLPAVAPAAFANEAVVVNNNAVVGRGCDGTASCLSYEELNFTSRCTGSADAPTAPAGWLCIYPTTASNAVNIRAFALPNDSSRYGFFVRWSAKSTGKSAFRGVWAYTAP